MYLKGSMNYITKPNTCAEHFNGRCYSQTPTTRPSSPSAVLGWRVPEVREKASSEPKTVSTMEGRGKSETGEGRASNSLQCSPLRHSIGSSLLSAEGKQGPARSRSPSPAVLSNWKGISLPLIHFWVVGSFLVLRKAPAFSVSRESREVVRRSPLCLISLALFPL